MNSVFLSPLSERYCYYYYVYVCVCVYVYVYVYVHVYDYVYVYNFYCCLSFLTSFSHFTFFFVCSFFPECTSPIYKKSPIPNIRHSPTTACQVGLNSTIKKSRQDAKDWCASSGALLPRLFDQFEHNQFYNSKVIT